MSSEKSNISIEYDYILLIRSQKVILDADLAKLFGVSTKRLNEQVKRNRSRFPVDFMFTLNKTEKQEVVANCDHLKKLKYSHSLPCAFTEHGTIMAANVLNSKKAIAASIYVTRTFIKLRELLASNKDLAHKLAQVEQVLQNHSGHIRTLFDAIKQLTIPPDIKPKRIGFITQK